MIETLENSSFVISKAHNTFPLCPSCVTSTSLCPLLHLLPPSPSPTHLHLLTSLTPTYSPPSSSTHLPHHHLLTSLTPTYSPPSPPPTYLPHLHLLTSLISIYSPPSPPPTHLPHHHLLTSLTTTSHLPHLHLLTSFISTYSPPSSPPTHLPHHHLLTSLLQPLPALGDTGASITCSVLLLCVSLVGTLGQPLFQFTLLSNSTYQLPYCELFCGS